MNCCFRVDSTEVPTGGTCSIIWRRRLPSGVGICSHHYLSVISVNIYFYVYSHIHTHSLTAVQLLRSRVVVVRKTSGKRFWNWAQRATRSWLVRGPELPQHEQSGNRCGRWRPFSGMEGFDVQTSATCLSVSLEVCDEVWKSGLWKPFLRFSYNSRIHYKNIYVCQYIDFSKEMIYICHLFLQGGSYICRWFSFEQTYKLFTLILNSLHGWSLCFARLRPKTRFLTHKVQVWQCTSVTLSLEGGMYEDLWTLNVQQMSLSERCCCKKEEKKNRKW